MPTSEQATASVRLWHRGASTLPHCEYAQPSRECCALRRQSQGAALYRSGISSAQVRSDGIERCVSMIGLRSAACANT